MLVIIKEQVVGDEIPYRIIDESDVTHQDCVVKHTNTNVVIEAVHMLVELIKEDLING